MKFVLQGLRDETHTNELNALFEIPAVQSALFSVAFVNESGVTEIEERIKEYSKKTTVFAGIRNNITSYQGLKRLHEIIGENLYIFDTGSRTVLFHPKFYLVIGNLEAKLMVGSANLTLGGLNNNIEASVIAELDLSDEDDKVFVDEITELISGLPAEYPSHVTKVKSIKEIDELLASGRIVDETQLPPVIPMNLAPEVISDTIPRIKLKVKPIRAKLTKALLEGQPKAKVKAKQKAEVIPAATLNIGSLYELVWESKPLTRRDLTIPDDKVTHSTGSMNLDKGLLSEEIDHRHYFRDEVFSGLTWTRRSATVEETSAKFEVVLKGVSFGEFDLAIRHTHTKTSKAYKQHNAMTRLSWGPVKTKIARPDLIDRALRVYRNRVDRNKYLVEID